MKREEKNALSRQRILDAALGEFSEKGYDGASLNTICEKNDISKGIVYHYFKDKDELYLLCASECFEKLTQYLTAVANTSGTTEQMLTLYFDARLKFFAENPNYLGIFLNATLTPPVRLCSELAEVRKPFDALNLRTLTELLESSTLRSGLSVSVVAEDFRMYMDYFNARFRTVLANADSPEQALHEHEERSHRQLGILLYGVLEKQHE